MDRKKAIKANLKMLAVKIKGWEEEGIAYKTNHHIQQVKRMSVLDEYSEQVIANKPENISTQLNDK